MRVDLICDGGVLGDDVGFFVNEDVAAQLVERATLCFECKNFSEVICKQNGVAAHVGTTVDENFGFVSEPFGPVNQVTLRDSDVVHLAAPRVVVVHQKCDGRGGHNQRFFRTPEISSHELGLSVNIVAALG